jgi:hypothetical protein
MLIDAFTRRTKLGCMSPLRLRDFARIVPSRGVIALSLWLLGGCGREEPAVHADSLPPGVAPVVAPAPGKATDNGWNAAAGPALLVQGATRDEAIALFPAESDSDAVARLDSASLSEVPVTLFGRGGIRYSAQLGAPTGEGTDDCERWPLHSFQPAGTASWSVGFVTDRVQPLALDSVDVLSSRDSMTIVAEVSRLASSVTTSTSAAFQGLRFTVEDVRRFQASPGVSALVAQLVRHINQEASPQEEQTLLVAERDSGMTAGPYHLAYAERAFGHEGDVESSEVLAGVRIGPSRVPSLIIAKDDNDGIRYAMLERTGAGQWRLRWSSGLTSCG